MFIGPPLAGIAAEMPLLRFYRGRNAAPTVLSRQKCCSYSAVLHKIQALWCDVGGELLQPLPLGPGLGQQLILVVRWMAAFQHFAEYPVGIVAAFVGALGVFIVDPR